MALHTHPYEPRHVLQRRSFCNVHTSKSNQSLLATSPYAQPLPLRMAPLQVLRPIAATSSLPCRMGNGTEPLLLP